MLVRYLGLHINFLCSFEIDYHFLKHNGDKLAFCRSLMKLPIMTGTFQNSAHGKIMVCCDSNIFAFDVPIQSDEVVDLGPPSYVPFEILNNENKFV